MTCAPNEDSDQPGHSPSLITASLLSKWRNLGSRAQVILLVLSWGGHFYYNWTSAQQYLWNEKCTQQKKTDQPAQPHILVSLCCILLRHTCTVKTDQTDLRLLWANLSFYSFAKSWLKNKHTVIKEVIESTVKFLKIRTPENFAVIILKLEQYCFTTE